jgi:hypothetical protein
MKTVVVRYKVKPDRVAENEELVRAVYDELHRAQPDGLHYATFRLDDGVSFMHLSATEADENPLTRTEAFARFTESIRERCDEPPAVTAVEEIGSYRVFGSAP